MKRKLIIMLLALSLLLSSCYYPIHDGNGKQVEVSNEKEDK